MSSEIPTSFDVRDKNEFHKSCAWILNQTHTQTMGTCYKSAVASYEISFKQCVANKKANLGFGKDYYNAIDNKAKEIVMNPQNHVGGLYGGFRYKMFDALKRGDDSGKFIAQNGPEDERVASIQREIIENGPVTSGFTVPMNFPYSDPANIPFKVDPAVCLGGNHVTTIIGWDTDNYGGYWKCKNSWKSNQEFKIRFNQHLGIEKRVFSSTIKPHQQPPIVSNPTLVQQYDDLEMKFFEGSVHNDYLAVIGGDWGWKNGDGGGVEKIYYIEKIYDLEKIYGLSHFRSTSEPYEFQVSLPISFSNRSSYPRFRSNDETNPALIGGDWGFNDMK